MRLWAVLLLTVTVFVSAARADVRVALVIGNGSYEYVPRLANPANDARLIATTLRDLGFTVVGDDALLDLNKSKFDKAVQEFGRAAIGADVALFYYAGHGVQVRGANYLVPIEANPTKEADVDFQMLDVNVVLRQMESAGARLNVLVLDACRNNPFSGRGLRTATGGLAQMQAPEGTLISFATQPGNVARDGSDGHSPFSKAISETIRKPGLDIFRSFNEVGLSVSRATKGEQQPWLSLSPIKGDFYFAGPLTVPLQGKETAALQSNPSQTPPGVRDPADIVRLLKIHLQEVGCDPGDLDGQWTTKASSALSAFNKYAGTHIDTEAATLETLDAVRVRSGRVCPLNCAAGMQVRGDRCVAITPKTASKPPSPDKPQARSASTNSSTADLVYRCKSNQRSACQSLCEAGAMGFCKRLNRIRD